jgi:hypothetical protein
VSLRTDIHVAFDELAPSTAGMPERVAQSAVLTNTRRRPLQPAAIWLRAPLSLVAMLLVIAIVVGVLVGGRALGGWGRFIQQHVPAGGINLAQLQLLEARTLRLPQLKAGESCPAGPWDPATGRSGSGPLYLFFQGGSADAGDVRPVQTPWGSYFFRQAVTEANLNGPVLVRARVLDTNQPLIFVGDYASGAFTGMDNLQGREVLQHSELVLDPTHPPATRSGELISWSFVEGLPKAAILSHKTGESSTGPVLCAGWQVDGLDFSERFVTSEGWHA